MNELNNESRRVAYPPSGEPVCPSRGRLGYLFWLIRLPRQVLILLVRLYQWTLSPLIGRQCRFIPTCSNYMIQSLEKYGAIWGSLKGLWRILRCNPFCKGGYDPVE